MAAPSLCLCVHHSKSSVMHNEMADKMDVLMNVMQEFILFICFHDGQCTPLSQCHCNSCTCAEIHYCTIPVHVQTYITVPFLYMCIHTSLYHYCAMCRRTSLYHSCTCADIHHCTIPVHVQTYITVPLLYMCRHLSSLHRSINKACCESFSCAQGY